ncbi:clostripain-related cysteine peptidase [Flavihumibacter solisilvae]|uniref:Uncharacterized protein n=1 Tax=Flavihumibacter solisilvae TaxID=1349421 RepID=A0A0C1L5X0_9BACT|nr:clostripain-related cysteine peptidase [Flavihumibacter solisilvae]KIC95497.1 hypothetical protein OI18_06370 [Flavihumibacter solisilvae]
MNVINFDWLMVFFVHEITMYRKILNKILDSIERVGNGQRNCIRLVFDKLEESNGKQKAKRVIIVYELEKGSDDLKEFYEFREIKTFSDWRTAILYVFDNVDAKRKAFFTWSHGAAFGINVSDLVQNKIEGFTQQEFTEDQIVEVRNDQWYLPQSRLPEISGFLKLSEDFNLGPDEYLVLPRDKEINCEKLVLIWMSDLADVLSKVTKKCGKIDLMIMTNCNMMLFENGYMLRNNVDILIGSESKMWALGYDYEKLIIELNKPSQPDNEVLAKMIVKDYVDKHRRLGHNKYLARTSMFACRLSETEKIAEILDSVTKSLLRQNSLMKDMVELVRKVYLNSVSGVGTYFLVDLGLWIETIFANLKSIGLDQNDLKQFRDIYEKIPLEQHVGAGYFADDQNGHKKYGHSGFSLFLPTDGLFMETRKYAWCAYSAQVQTVFKNEFMWDEFILKLTANEGFTDQLQVVS